MRTLIAIILISIWSNSYGQLEKKFIEEGYANYQEGEFEQASENFLDALDIDPGNYEATYNYGDALFRMEKFEEAGIQFEQIVEKAPDKIRKAECYHNLGNCLLQQGKLEDCIDAYKNSLRNNPEDHETRYNLAFAQKLLKEQQQQQQQQQQDQEQNQDQQDNQDKNQENQDNQENQENQENQDQKKKQNKGDQKDEEQNQQPQQGEKQKISKEDAERILQSLMRKEKNTQEKLKKKEQKKVEKVKIEKDW